MNTKKKNYVKLVLDIAMGVTFALLFNKRVLGGMAFHEIAGLALGFAVMVHVLLNIQFVKKITMRLFDKTLPTRTRLNYFLNVLLLLFMAFVIVSGLLISKVVLPNFRFGNENWFKMAHMSISYLTLVLIGIHIGLHWHWVVGVFSKMLNVKVPRLLGRSIMISLAALVLAYGGYQAYTTNFISKLAMVQNVVNVSSSSAGHGGMEGKPGAANGAPAAGGQNAGAQKQAGRPGEMGGGNFQSPGFLSVILTYFGIMGVFAGITYYLDKGIAVWRKRMKASAA